MSCLDCSQFHGPFISYSFPKSKSADEILPKYVLPSPSPHTPVAAPRAANLKVIVKVGKAYAGRKILYWGAEPPTKQALVNQAEAYGQYKNMGTTVVQPDGTATFFLRQPQVYKVGRRAYPAHVHYSLASFNGKTWSKKVGAAFAPRHGCNLSPKLQKCLLLLDSSKGGDLLDRMEGRPKDGMYGVCGPRANALLRDLIHLGYFNVFLA